MHYLSTRGQTEPKNFSDVLLMGLAPDGGLMLPESYPAIDVDTLAEWRTLSYPQLAFAVMRLFVTDIPEADLQTIINNTYTQAAFGSDDITPVRQLNDGIYIQGLSNGPTLAFKDIAMQFLGNAFEYVLEKRGEVLNIIGATSGDTGSAAEYALRGKHNIDVFMLSPHGKMSAFQRAQMYSLDDANIHNIAVKGMFDDCQDIVKALQSDHSFKQKHNLGTVNSINWGRVLAQIVYYFKGYFAVTENNNEKVSFCVPSGNFGNVCAGHIAKQMGLPIDRLIVATNENDVLNEFFATGHYRPRTGAETQVTSSPSMDISKASNFERFMFDLVGRDGNKITTLWQEVNMGKGFDVAGLLNQVQQTYGFVAGKSVHQDRLNTIKAVYDAGDGLIDPHTADGIKVARELRQNDETIICLETALPIKFSDTITEAVGKIDIPRPEKLQGLESLPQHVSVIESDATVVKTIIETALT